ncbi:MAG: hypothetical protein HYV27_11940 [Candidatus Hydrogenedentes bacterium]|nr:hypothetical protein [Candidatus Hydrogenedentota bacterium]
MQQWETDLAAKYEIFDPESNLLQFVADHRGEVDRIRKENAGARKETLESIAALTETKSLAELRLSQLNSQLAALIAKITETERQFITLSKLKPATADLKAMAEHLATLDEDKARLIVEIQGVQKELAVATGSLGAAQDTLKSFSDSLRHDRNKIIGDLIIIAKGYHETKDDGIREKRAGFNILADVLQIGSSGIASIAGSESTARALAALSTGTGGIQESVDKRLFYEHATSALLSTMHTMRLEQEQVLIANMAKSLDEYPLELALDDWVTFLLAGGVTDALRKMGVDAAAKELKELNSLTKLREAQQANIDTLAEEAKQKAAEEAEVKALETEIRKKIMQGILGSIPSPPAPPAE